MAAKLFHTKPRVVTLDPMAARKLAPMAVGVRPKREIIREPGQQRMPAHLQYRMI